MLNVIPIEFWLFGLTLAGVALFHDRTLTVALAGLAAVVAYKLAATGFASGPGVPGLLAHLDHEWVTLANLFLLLLGFAMLAAHFHDSRVPDVLPAFLPDDWKGGLVLLLVVFVMSAFLDNIAAAVIGGTVASTVYRGKVHVGFLAAIVAASNAGGAGSVVGDTTTTMMWIAGVRPAAVLHAYVASGVAFAFFAIIAARQQQGHASIVRDAAQDARVDKARLGIVVFMLAAAVAANVVVNLELPQLAERFPFLGVTIWVALLLTAGVRRPAWQLLPGAIRGSVFLLSLVLTASMMPIERLPAASWQTALGLGFVSAVFDNIPLTALALKQGGYDWGMLAYAVGFGGSMLWFGSSAGVALSNQFPEAKSVVQWIRQGWHVAIAYPVGFFALLWLLGWEPEPENRAQDAVKSSETCIAACPHAGRSDTLPLLPGRES